uniref:Uncharacterized protein n=1 Tax=Romanomermis culicivorax TaxID=13658 RepID=A0A915J660_ROMCU
MQTEAGQTYEKNQAEINEMKVAIERLSKENSEKIAKLQELAKLQQQPQNCKDLIGRVYGKRFTNEQITKSDLKMVYKTKIIDCRPGIKSKLIIFGNLHYIFTLNSVLTSDP